MKKTPQYDAMLGGVQKVISSLYGMSCDLLDISGQEIIALPENHDSDETIMPIKLKIPEPQENTEDDDEY